MCLVADRLARDLPADLPVLFDYRHGPSSKAGASPFFLVASSDEPRSGPRAGWFPRLAVTPEREELERGVQGHVILVAVRVDSSLLRHSARAASRRYGSGMVRRALPRFPLPWSVHEHEESLIANAMPELC
jgi:hypothetical protein